MWKLQEVLPWVKNVSCGEGRHSQEVTPPPKHTQVSLLNYQCKDLAGHYPMSHDWAEHSPAFGQSTHIEAQFSEHGNVLGSHTVPHLQAGLYTNLSSVSWVH